MGLPGAVEERAAAGTEGGGLRRERGQARAADDLGARRFEPAPADLAARGEKRQLERRAHARGGAGQAAAQPASSSAFS